MINFETWKRCKHKTWNQFEIFEFIWEGGVSGKDFVSICAVPFSVSDKFSLVSLKQRQGLFSSPGEKLFSPDPFCFRCFRSLRILTSIPEFFKIFYFHEKFHLYYKGLKMRILGFWQKETGAKRVSMGTTPWIIWFLFWCTLYISGAKFVEHCFNISRDIVYTEFYHFSCTPLDVITFWRHRINICKAKKK